MGSYPAGRQLIVYAGEEQPGFRPLEAAFITLVGFTAVSVNVPFPLSIDSGAFKLEIIGECKSPSMK